jgi:murein DD-endopeptidase MepM/ murein hydrolase activator NlpD
MNKTNAQTIWRFMRLVTLTIILTFVSIQPGLSSASPASPGDNQIVLPDEGWITVDFIGTSASCTGNFGLHSPQEVLVFPNYLYYAGLRFRLPGHLEQDTELVFYITPQGFCSGSTYLSSDPNRARISHPDPNRWIINWEDWNDGDFNDLTVQVDFQPGPLPIFDLPFDYTNFADESRDSEQEGKITAYLDHQYPTGYATPNAPTRTNTVNFYGYDSSQTNPPSPYHIEYDGHDGIDYKLPMSTSVLAATTGTVAFVGQSSGYCWLTGKVETANGIIIQHANNYVTEYWHLSSFAPEVQREITVTRDLSHPIGYSGNTGCSDGPHLHFRVRNPSEIVVDPYGWKPLPDAAWYDQTDPWQQYEADHGITATSYYMWIHPLETVALVSPSALTVITSTSGQVAATIPAGAYGAPLRVELAEALPSAHVPGYRSLRSFSLFGFTTNDVAVTTLGKKITLDVYVPITNTIQALASNDVATPTIHVWNAQSSTWQQLPTTWDPFTGCARAASSRIGTFALSIREYKVYLPIVFRSAD